jgi:hypothetical protein
MERSLVGAFIHLGNFSITVTEFHNLIVSSSDADADADDLIRWKVWRSDDR